MLPRPDVLQVSMVRPNNEGMLCALQPVPSFLKGELNGQQLPIPDFIIPFCGRETAGKEGTWMKFTFKLLRQDHPDPGF